MKTLKLLVLSLAFIACEKEEIEKPIQANEIKTKHLDKAAAQSVFMGEWFSTSISTAAPTRIVITPIDNNVYMFEGFIESVKTISEDLIQFNDSTSVGANMYFIKYNLVLTKKGDYITMSARVPHNNTMHLINQTYRR